MVVGTLRGFVINNINNNGQLMNRCTIAVKTDTNLNGILHAYIYTYDKEGNETLILFAKTIEEIYVNNECYYAEEIDFPACDEIKIRVCTSADYPTVVGTYYLEVYFRSGSSKSHRQAEIETIITAELVDGESIDNRIDALIALINHNDLQNINAGNDYEHLTAAQVAALHAIVVAGDLAHNSLAGIDANDIKHLTAVQIAALLTDGVSFPESPVDGELFWNETDEALYMYDSTATAWIQVGGGGIGIGFYGIGIASDTIVHSNDAERTTFNPVYEKLKEIIVYKNLKGCRISFEMKRLTVDGVYGKVCVNDIIIGDEFSTNSDTYVEFNRDVPNVKINDLVQIWGKRVGGVGGGVYIRNMKIKYDKYVNNDP